MTRSILSAAISACICCGNGLVSGAGMTLVKSGIPEATIILAQQPTRAAQFAAFELQHHIKLITGAAIPIVRDGESVSGIKLLVGESKGTRILGLTNDGFKEQEYLIKFTRNAIVFMGSDKADFTAVTYDLKNLSCMSTWPGFWDERSTTYAVYDFLMKFCGVRWFNPTDTGTIIPKVGTLTVHGQDIRRQPFFEYRDSMGACGDNVDLYDTFIGLWNDVNSKEYRNWEQAAYSGLHAQFTDANAYTGIKRMQIRLFLLRMKNGGKICRCNHSFYGYYDRFWKKNPNAPNLFEGKHPEYFAINQEGDRPTQLCYTNEGLIRQVAHDAVEYLQGKKTGAELGVFWNPQLPNPFPLEPMDNGSFCRCPDCQKWIEKGKDYHAGDYFSQGTDSDYFFHFVNEVAKEVKKTISDPKLVTLAYASHAWSPKTFELDPSVSVQFCFASNRASYALQEYDNDISALHAWASKKNPLYLWLYYGFPLENAIDGNFHCFPGFFSHTIGEEFRLFQKLGIRGMFHCGYGQEVEAYVTYRLMDEPTLDVDVLLDDYFTHLYGPAGKPMKQLYLGIEKTYTDPANYKSIRHPGGQNAQIAWGLLGTAERMDKFEKLMEEAKSLAATEQEKHNVELFDLGVWKYVTEGRAQYVEKMSAPIPAVRVPLVPDAAGNPANVEWNKSAVLTDGWFENGSNVPAPRSFSGRLAYDGKFLYMELVDPCDTKKLVTTPGVFPYDDWEIFIAAQRGMPYRHFAVSPAGQIAAASNGEVNWRMNVPLENNVRAVSNITAPDKWVTRLAFSLKDMVSGGVKAGDTIYFNVIRVSSPTVGGKYPLSIDTWVPYTTVHEVERLAKITLEE